MNSPILYNDPSGHKAVGDGENYDKDGNKQVPEEDPYEDDDTLSQAELANLTALLDKQKQLLEIYSFAARTFSVLVGAAVIAGVGSLGCATVALCTAGAASGLVLGAAIEEAIYNNLLGDDIDAINQLNEYLDSAADLNQGEYNFIITETEKNYDGLIVTDTNLEIDGLETVLEDIGFTTEELREILEGNMP